MLRPDEDVVETILRQALGNATRGTEFVGARAERKLVRGVGGLDALLKRGNGTQDSHEGSQERVDCRRKAAAR